MQTVVVIGTGRIAPGVAAACALAGASVRIVGRDRSRAEEAATAATALAGTTVSGGALGPDAFGDADVVIESIVEDRAIKQEVLRTIESELPEGAIVATNTSSLPIAELADALRRPDRFAGLHFLHPAQLTAVVEVVPGPVTSFETIDRLAELVRRMPKKPLVLQRDAPGFIWNRIQFAVLRECLHILDEGIADVAAIDAAVADGLAPRWLAAGPLATVDLGGIDTFRRAAEYLLPRLASGASVSESLSGRADAGGSFSEWTADSRKAIEALRAEALELGKRIAERRAGAKPS